MGQLILCGNVAYESVQFLGKRRIPSWPAEDGLADETVGFNREGAGKSSQHMPFRWSGPESPEETPRASGCNSRRS